MVIADFGVARWSAADTASKFLESPSNIGISGWSIGRGSNTGEFSGVFASVFKFEGFFLLQKLSSVPLHILQS